MFTQIRFLFKPLNFEVNIITFLSNLWSTRKSLHALKFDILLNFLRTIFCTSNGKILIRIEEIKLGSRSATLDAAFDFFFFFFVKPPVLRIRIRMDWNFCLDPDYCCGSSKNERTGKEKCYL